MNLVIFKKSEEKKLFKKAKLQHWGGQEVRQVPYFCNLFNPSLTDIYKYTHTNTKQKHIYMHTNSHTHNFTKPIDSTKLDTVNQPLKNENQSI